MEEIKETVREYLLEEFLPGENPNALVNSTPLITGGILDSISTVKLVSFLEDRFTIEFQAHEIDVANLNTVDDIARTIHVKREGK